MPIAASCAVLSKLPWKYIGAALAAIGLAFLLWQAPWAYRRGQHSRDAEVAALNGTIANMKAASAKALADNEAYVARINGLQDQITKDRNDDQPKQIAAGNAAIAEYVRLHPAPKAHPGGTGQDHAPGVPDAPGQPDAPADQAVVPVADLNACNEAWVTATGLQDWIRAEAAIQR